MKKSFCDVCHTEYKDEWLLSCEIFNYKMSLPNLTSSRILQLRKELCAPCGKEWLVRLEGYGAEYFGRTPQ